MPAQPTPLDPVRIAAPVSVASAPAAAVEQDLRDWIASVLGTVEIASTAPGPLEAGRRAVGLYPYALAPIEATRGTRAPPLQFMVRVLVTASTTADLFELAFAALARSDVEVDLQPLDATGWLAFGTAPRPAFALHWPVRKSRVEHSAPRVRAPLLLAPTNLIVLRGVVSGPGEVPMAGARVVLAGLGLAATTDRAGVFRFVGVPSGQALHLRVSARGSTQDFEAGTAGAAVEPLALRMQFPAPSAGP